MLETFIEIIGNQFLNKNIILLVETIIFDFLVRKRSFFVSRKRYF